MKFTSFLAAALFGTMAIVVVQPHQIVLAQSLQSSVQVETIARQVTVQIDGQAPGSGVIIAKQGQTYYVLTAAHVVETQDEYEVVTPDGKKYPLDYKLVRKFPGVDLALVQFTSPQTYQVVAMGRSSQLKEGTPLFVSGFPSAPGTNLTSTFQLSTGEVVAIATRPVGKGYAIAYLNDTFAGMSGGPVLNQQGQLVGIHGASKTAFAENQGVNPMWGVKDALNLGLPIDTFLRLVPKVNPALKFPTVTASVVSAQASSADLLIQFAEQLTANKTKEALTTIERAIRLNPNYASAYGARGIWRAEAGNYQEAIADYDQAIRLNPNLSFAYLYRAGSRVSLKDYRGAIADYDQMIRLNPSFLATYFYRGNAYLAAKDLPGAIAAAEQMIRLNPNFAPGYLLRGVIRRVSSNDLRRAISDYEQAIRLNPYYGLAYFHRGSVRNDLKDYQRAIADFDQAIRLNPKFTVAYNNRGIARIDLKDYQGAVADFDQAIRLDPNNATAYKNRAVARYRSGNREGALEDLQKAAQLAQAQGNQEQYKAIMRDIRLLQR